MRLRCGVARFGVLLLIACSAPPPLPSRAAFSEQIIAPLAEKRAGEMIEAWKADARLRVARNAVAGWNVDVLSLGSDYLALGTGAVLSSLNVNPNQQLEEYVAWLETRRQPLKAKLITLYESRIQEHDAGKVFAVCADGKERRYDRRPGFPRLDDGPGPCPTVQVSPNE